ncbi:hypothetical protein AM588_10002144 [Phytophthora nicotianae]|uniref:Uncharacterized protein n=1 Tax=Phytophthora nicotianae TaxID=4792 RepID=A0A0W8CYK8_PHYNI|nr:hypothetical protein AM588_10002144 [Phytophthora nicotianae]
MSALNLNNLFDVKDKVVVITGGGRGIGKMMADGFVQNGAKVYIASRRLEACEATAKELNVKGPGKCIPMSKGISVVTGLGMDDLATGIPIQRFGLDSDMAGLAIFLSSKASGWITGMVIASDGGQVYTMETGVGPLSCRRKVCIVEWWESV